MTTPARVEVGRSHLLLSLLREHRLPVLCVLGMTVVTGLAGGLEPWLLGNVLDASSSRSLPELAKAVAALAAMALTTEWVRAFALWRAWNIRIAVSQALLVATVGHLQRLPLAFHREHRLGETLTQLDRGTQNLVAAFADLAFQVVPAMVYLGTAAVVMFRLEPRLAAWVVLLAPLPLIVAALASPEQVERERELMGRWTRLFGRFHEVLHGILTVKSFGMEHVEHERFIAGVRTLNGRVLSGVARDAQTDTLRASVVVLVRVSAVGAGGWLAWHGEATPGTVLTFAAYVGGLFSPLQSLGASLQLARRATVAAEVVSDLLDRPLELSEGSGARSLPVVRGHVELRDVTFGYDPSRPILAGLDLSVAPGECVALVGPSGSGKSTIVGLIQRLYAPQRGSVTVDGHDVGAFDPQWWRKQVGVVLQDGVLFDDTIAENIRYGRPDASEADVRAAARSAWADDFIRALPHGYDTRVGERGSALSAGQRQRIAIARALLVDPPILILDEATSALDTASEFEIQRALRGLIRGRTTLIVAHRLSTVASADRIVALDHGRIIEEGTHAELLARGGYYASLIALSEVA